MAQDLKDTLQLPKTDFPMRAGLAQREPVRLVHWEKLGLYDAMQRKRAGAPAFVLHDGPPFTNGDVHIGTALNKTLKDIIIRYKSMRGFRTPYVPGWDCHGLPIEQKVTRDLPPDVSVGELRKKCADFSEGWIGRQKAQFQRLGVLGDWKNEYRTKDPAFEADILRTFAAFVEKGLVDRRKKPVYYSIPFETALAEAEIEYKKDHVSPSIWVAFPISDPKAPVTKPAGSDYAGLTVSSPLVEVSPKHGICEFYFVIWTTTPWTLPANLAIALHPQTLYAIVRFGDKGYIVAEKLVTDFINATKEHFKGQHAVILLKDDFGFLGEELEGIQARHPFIDRAAPVVLANYVTTESGTGCVHTAPGHGLEDYQTGLRYNLAIFCPIDGKGRYAPDPDYPKIEMPSDLIGKSTLESVEDLAAKKTSEANIAVLQKLDTAGALLAKRSPPHSYPYCWRSKTPIIYCAQYQWFVLLDKAGARQAAIEAIGGVQWIPAWGENRIRGAVESRPDWCISRQRAWGVPIPAFFDAKKNVYLDAGVVRAIADNVQKQGTSLWFGSTAQELLAGVKLPDDWPAPSALTPGCDTLDVWFDSGSTHAAVLKKGRGGTHWPADLYLEGSDQHRGWFQSSLWTSVIAFGAAPYRTVLTHGFIVDEDRRKISKSGIYEKPQTSDAYIAEHGADVIRLWIASQDFRDDIPISKEILSHVGEAYRSLRNTFRFQLSNLFDFEPEKHAVTVAEMDTLDRWALHQTAGLIRQCTAACDAYEFHKVYQLCNQFCAVTLSATYHDILKDRLYTLGAAHHLRRSSQTAIHHIFHVLVRVLAPVIPFTTDEAWSFATAGAEHAGDSVHLQDWPVAPADWTNAAIDADITQLLALRSTVNEKLEALRQAGAIGKSLEAAVVFSGAPDDTGFHLLEKHRDFLPELFIVSHVSLSPASGALDIAARPARELGHVRCPRCWRWVPELRQTRRGELCARCADTLGA